MYRAFLAAALLLIAGATAHAAELPLPKGEVVLTIVGDGIKNNTQEGAEFDRAMLEALPQHAIDTTTPWHDGMMRFEGPLMLDIMKLVAASGTGVTVSALDEYSVDIPLEKFTDAGPILALLRNGEPMPADDQGPIFIIFDYDSDPALNTDEIHSYSVWSVRRMMLK